MDTLWQRLTKQALATIQTCQKRGKNSDVNKLNALLLVEAILKQKGSLGNQIARSLQINQTALGRILLHQPQAGSTVSVYDAITKAYQIAARSKNPYVGTEHLLYGVLSFPSQAKLLLPKTLLVEQSVEKLIQSTMQSGDSATNDPLGELHILIEQFMTPKRNRQRRASYLRNHCTNLNDVVTSSDHKLIGRATELERISNVLGRKMKNNPVLIGDPGVGKTAIVEGLALQINEGKAPFYLHGKRILSLDLGSLVAGTTFRGEFEARLKEIVQEAKQDSSVILFIDEIHNLVGAGNAVGGMDAANLLKPALSRGEIQIIGATTFDEYRKHIEKDAALERRFQPIFIDEPSIEETIDILHGIKPSYEAYHSIKISDTAIHQAAFLAKRYLHDRFLPDSAIDLIDETAARNRATHANAKVYQQLREIQTQLQALGQEKEQMVMQDQYETAIRLRDEEKMILTEQQKLKQQQLVFEQAHPILVTDDDIRITVSSLAKIPLALLQGKDQSFVTSVQQLLTRRLVGQPEVIRQIVLTLKRQYSGIGTPNRPLGSFLFIGPTGVGKTLAAKLLATSLSPASRDNLIQINMSEYMERHTVSRLLGAPAGYVGYDDSSELIDKVRRNPYSVILFDEIEKADPSVLNILLQILEDGVVSDPKGRQINFKNTIIILTSNIGVAELNQVSKLGFEGELGPAMIKQEAVNAAVLEEIKEQLPVELLNRLDHILIFNTLGRKEIEAIVRNEFWILNERLKQKSIVLHMPAPMIRFIAQQCIDPDQGARLVRRKIEQQIEPLLADYILRHPKTHALTLSHAKDRLMIKSRS